MTINKTCNLVLHDVYSYDIVSAFPTILSKQCFDFERIDLDDKEQRNRYIGLKQRNNSNLSEFLNDSVTSILDYYLTYNGIKEHEVISRQKDGFILSKALTSNNTFIEMKLRDVLTNMIISIDRTSFVYLSDTGKLSVKGISHCYDKLNDIYKRIVDLNLYNKTNLFSQMNSIKEYVMTTDDMKLFAIEQDDSSYIFIYDDKSIKVKNIEYIDPKLVCRQKYFSHYFKPFLDSIFLETTRK